MMRWLWVAIFCVGCVGGGRCGAAEAVVVCPPAYRAAIENWLAYRRRQGHQLTVLDSAQDAESIRRRIIEVADGASLRYVVLMGDAEPMAARDPRIAARSVPTFYRKAKVNIRWKSTERLSTDIPYADLDGDGLPELAVGRLPADSAAELQALLEKVMRYEQRPIAGSWQRRINFIAGVGGFGALIDPVLELAARRLLTDGIPDDYATTMTYANWRSPYCPSPARFRQETLNRLNEGCLFWVYMGHGLPYQLDRVQVVDRSYPIFNVGDLHKLQSRRGAPIAVFLACYVGAFDLPYDCLGEQMVRQPGGPIAVFAGTRVTMPYANSILGKALMEAYFEQRRTTIGQVVLFAQKQLGGEDQSGQRKLIDLIATLISPEPGLLAAERKEHILLYNLLGDPMLRLVHPPSIQLQTVAQVDAGGYLEVRGTTPVAGRCTLELICQRDALRFQRPSRSSFDPSPAAQQKYDSIYQLANNPAWTTRSIDLERGSFLTALQVPSLARGVCHVRALVQTADGKQIATGSTKVTVKPPAADAGPVTRRLEDHSTDPAGETEGGSEGGSDGARPIRRSLHADPRRSLRQ